MVQIVLVVREIDRPKPDYSLPFDLPEIPRVGDYISVYRPDSDTHTEDVVVRHVWWQLHHPETGGFPTGAPKVGRSKEVIVECDVAVGPFARDRWRAMAEAAKNRGAEVVTFGVERFSVSEAELKKMGAAGAR